jgi:predicted N-acetyltransferase YhbS
VISIEPLAAHPALAEALAQWHHAEWSALMPDWSYAMALDELRDHATRRTVPTTLTALDGDALLGSVSLIDVDAEQFTDLRPWLASLYVVSAARGRGLGKMLVRAVQDLAAKLGEREVFLFTAHEIDFYLPLGWRVVERRRLFDNTVSIMRWRKDE